MSKDRDFYYITLGLQPGASPAEIKSAFRRLVKLYHPDHDQSLDGEMRYREIREAYRKLIDKRVSSKTRTTSGDFPSKQATWTSGDPSGRYAENKQNFSKGTTWSSEDWAVTHGCNQRLPFKLNNTPFVFIRSLMEISAGGFIKGVFVLAAAIASLQLEPRGPLVPGVLAALFYIVTWFFYFIIRYYYDFSALASSYRIFIGILYGSMLALLIACFYTAPNYQLIVSGFLAAVSMWFLIIVVDK